MVYNQVYQPEQNAGMGLIFRLNALWEKSDRKALSGDYDGWELILDRIFSNLMYREESEKLFDDEGKIIKIEFNEDVFEEWQFVKKSICMAKTKTQNSKRENYKQAQHEWYLKIMYYDIWLRKFMQSLGGLYLKESESNPSRALFGGAFTKKR